MEKEEGLEDVFPRAKIEFFRVLFRDAFKNNGHGRPAGKSNISVLHCVNLMMIDFDIGGNFERTLGIQTVRGDDGFIAFANGDDGGHGVTLLCVFQAEKKEGILPVTLYKAAREWRLIPHATRGHAEREAFYGGTSGASARVRAWPRI